jgi:hypothetical protein
MVGKIPQILVVKVIPNGCPTLPYSYLDALFLGKKQPKNSLWRGILRGRVGGTIGLGNEPTVLGNLFSDGFIAPIFDSSEYVLLARSTTHAIRGYTPTHCH